MNQTKYSNSMIRSVWWIAVFTLLLSWRITTAQVTLNIKGSPDAIEFDAAASDTLAISVSNISIDNEFQIRGLSSDFPYPVLSTISVVDKRGNSVLGLADTSRWLGPDDETMLGLKISDIWQTILEYHEEDNSVPADQNVFNQLPQPIFTEIRESLSLPTKTMLVMDISSSMREEIGDAKAGALHYVEQMRDIDEAGIILFYSQIIVAQSLTNDKQLLRNAINNAQLQTGTAAYDGIMQGVRELKGISGRVGVIAYTDGLDNRSTATAQAVIDSANSHNVPVFAIGLGNNADNAVLRRIGENSGGLFFQVATAEEMKQIYTRLSVLFKNFYFMAHTSTDPAKNNTTRVVDISVAVANYYGRGTGTYFVPGEPEPELSDLAITLNSVTDSTLSIDERNYNAVQPGEMFSYRIGLNNIGPANADTMRVFQFLPDSVQFVSADIQPNYIGTKLLTWDFVDVSADDSIALNISVQFQQDVPADLLTLASSANVTAGTDIILSNNFAVDTVKVLVPEQPPVILNYDLALTQTVETDSSGLLDEQLVPLVLRGDTVKYSLRINNLGPGVATNVILFDVIPDSTQPFNFNVPPSSVSLNTHFWQIDTIDVGAEFNLTFDAKVSDSLKIFPFELTNTAVTVAERDTNAINDSTITVVYAIPRPEDNPPVELLTDISVSQRASTDSISVAGSDTTRIAMTGETYTYTITVSNDSDAVARNVVVKNIFPDYIQASEFSLAPALITPDSVVWNLGVMPRLSKTQISFSAFIPETTPVGFNLLINEISVSAENEPAELTLNNTSVDTVLNISPPDAGLLPLIEASPPVVNVGDPVSVRVLGRVENESWDLWVIPANNIVETGYADEFIQNNTPLPLEQWLNIQPQYTNTRLVTRAEEEQLIFELRTKDVYGRSTAVRAQVLVRSDNGIVIDQNVFVPDRHGSLRIRFQLSSNRDARIDLYDVAGSFITKIAEQEFSAGWNTLEWTGRKNTGENIGSGVYLITVRSGDFSALRKVMVVR